MLTLHINLESNVFILSQFRNMVHSSSQFFFLLANFYKFFSSIRLIPFCLFLSIQYSFLIIIGIYLPQSTILNFLSWNHVHNWEHYHSITSIYYFEIFSCRQSMINNKRKPHCNHLIQKYNRLPSKHTCNLVISAV